MAALAHFGVGLAAKRLAPTVPLGVLLVAALGIDIVFMVCWLAGLEQFSASGVVKFVPYSHGLFMSLVWSVLAFLVATRLLRRSRQTGVIIGLLVFSHWVLDFITHPMTAVFPSDVGLPLFFQGSPKVGLGLYSYPLAVNVVEYGTLALGILVYGFTLRKLKKERRRQLVTEAGVREGADRAASTRVLSRNEK
jgi:membrane-bound metal-dependent hydrolase YbcI (DUF457 family)